MSKKNMHISNNDWMYESDSAFYSAIGTWVALIILIIIIAWIVKVL